MNSYKLTKVFFAWALENPEQINPNLAALYFYAIELCNSLGWKPKFTILTGQAMASIGIKSYHTYIKAFNELEKAGFIEVVTRSRNQYTANIIALSYFAEAQDEAPIKASEEADENTDFANTMLCQNLTKHTTKHSQSKDSIHKTIKTNNLQNLKHLRTFLQNDQKTPPKETVLNFSQFWELYDKKVKKVRAEKIFKKITEKERAKILEHLPLYKNSVDNKSFLKNPDTYLYQKAFNDEEVINYKTIKNEQKPAANRTNNAKNGSGGALKDFAEQTAAKYYGVTDK